MSKRVWAAVLASAVLGTVLLSGCSRKPKLDLTGLRTGPAAGSEGVAGVPGFDPLGGLGQQGAGGAEEGWSDLNSPLRGDGNGYNINAIDDPWAKVVIYFAFDSAALGQAELPKLEALAGNLRQHPEYAVVIEGHCDDRGSDEYNRALGEKRALVVRDHLISLGIDAGRLETVSYGEERPAVPNATDESQHALNRRAQFVIGTRN